MLDETIISEIPPLYSCYGRLGQQVSVPILGDRNKRVLHGAINVGSGDVLLLITKVWEQTTHQYFLEMIRAHWSGWNIILFEDRGTPHKAEDSLDLAKELRIEVRLLPKATPELNAMDQLWRRVKGYALANSPVATVDKLADDVCQHIFELTPHKRLQQAGVLSGNFWLTN